MLHYYGQKLKEVRIILKTKFGRLLLKNPLMNASGPISGDAEKINFCITEGLGAVVTKTISMSIPEIPSPCIMKSKKSIMNCELWSEKSVEEWEESILTNISNQENTPILISLGYSKSDITELIPRFEDYADAFEISTHYTGSDLSVIYDIVSTARNITKKPIYIKLSPSTPDIIGFVRTIKNAGADGVVVLNSLGPTLSIDICERKIKCGSIDGYSWISGESIKPLSLGLIYKIRKEFNDLTIIGVGGISSAEDIIEFLLAGADAVQILSAAMIYGKNIYSKILHELPCIMQKYGFKSIEEVKQTKLINLGNIDVKRLPEIKRNKCTRCGLCENICPYFAIKLINYPIVKQDKCFSCGLCESSCPVNAISGVISY